VLRVGLAGREPGCRNNGCRFDRCGLLVQLDRTCLFGQVVESEQQGFGADSGRLRESGRQAGLSVGKGGDIGCMSAAAGLLRAGWSGGRADRGNWTGGRRVRVGGGKRGVA